MGEKVKKLESCSANRNAKWYSWFEKYRGSKGLNMFHILSHSTCLPLSPCRVCVSPEKESTGLHEDLDFNLTAVLCTIA